MYKIYLKDPSVRVWKDGEKISDCLPIEIENDSYSLEDAENIIKVLRQILDEYPRYPENSSE